MNNKSFWDQKETWFNKIFTEHEWKKRRMEGE